ncbi:gas vesicle protein GvpG [Plantactinospora siamensis]|uniref:Gas vesicle protein GvpG n=1 Tax=Plantactinospora siamensis TaxID=555372 RepID=A0ABV6NUJ3_9ACTN
MDILTALLTLPYAPVRGLTSVVKTLHRQAEEQLYDPANVRRELEGLDAALAAGDLSAEDHALAQQQVLDRLIAPGGAPREGESGQPGLALGPAAGRPRRRAGR